MTTAANTTSVQSGSSANLAQQLLEQLLAEELVLQQEQQEQVTGQAASASVKSQGLVSTQAPTLTSGSSSTTQGGYLSQLVQYMQIIVLAAAQLVKNNSQVSQFQSQVGGSAISLMKNQEQQAVTNNNKLQAALEKQRHESFWERIGSAIAGALLCIIGAVTGNFELCVVSGFMLAMTFSGGSQALSNALSSLPLGAKIAAEVGIALGAAVCLAGGSALLGAQFAAEAAPAVVAEEAAVQGGVQANAVGEAAANAAEENAAEAVEPAAEPAGGAPAADAAPNANPNAEPQAEAAKVKNSTYAKQLAGITLQTTLAVNPFTDISAAFIKLLRDMGATISTESATLASEISGMVMAIVAGIAGGALSSSAASEITAVDGANGVASLATRIEAKLGSAVYSQVKTLMNGSFLAFQGLSSALNIGQGVAGIAEANATKEFGQNQAVMEQMTNVTNMVNTQAATNDGAESQVNNAYQAIMQLFQSYIQQYSASANTLAQ